MELPDGVKMTPMIEQYLNWKKQYPDCLLFYRIGDFYEMFFDDAKTASSVLDIVLTSRSKDSEYQVPMAGVPFHAVDSYLARLVSAGYRVAICDQMTEPDGRTLVEREVTRIVTPGTWLPENSDEEGRLAACSFDGGAISLATLVSADGTLRAGTFSKEQGASVLASFKPDEILIPKGQRAELDALTGGLLKANTVEREKSEFAAPIGAQWLCRKWRLATLDSMGIDDRDGAAGAACAALKYLEETQFSQAKHVTCVTPILPAENLILDRSTQMNLELTEPAGTSLYSVLNRCRTPMGKRGLKDWILAPLRDLDAIGKRQDAVAELISDKKTSARLRNLLSQCRDMAKSVSRLTLRMGAPADVLAVKSTLNLLPEIKSLAAGSPALAAWDDAPDLSGLSAELNAAVSDTVPRLIRDGGFVRSSYDAKLDEWRDKAAHSEEWLAEFEERERERTGIRTLKAGVNKVFGYYIEIGKGSAAKAPLDYIRKQTLVSAERYVTEELKNFERDMFSAEDEIQSIEEKIYEEIKLKILSESESVQRAAKFLAALDILLSLADLASERGYVRPEIDMSTDFVIKGGRHPVIEVALGRQPFTPNDFRFSEESGRRIAIITGPNMAGKSTYLRTAALIAIMAQMGSFVPAESARIGMIDRVFTRIGARDELARGQSTFMVEMVETANILRHATDRSLVVLDEVGRGTSTYDGLSIAWSVVEYLHGQESRQARVLFATHYHELTQLADTLAGVVNLSMAVEESASGVVFLHKVVEAPSDRSYGIEVARLAGVPSAVLRRSRELLEQFEEDAENKKPAADSQPQQLTLFDISQEAVLEELAAADPDSMTPMEALQLIYKLKAESRKALGFA